jgi:hypothetical protein
MGSGHPLCEPASLRTRLPNVLRCSELVLAGSALAQSWFSLVLRWLGVALSYLALEPNS